jgi:N-acyl-D-amino-acid deacylase
VTPSRRRFLLAAGGTAFGFRGSAAADDPPATGDAVPGLEPFDRLMTAFVRENGIPGAQLAVCRGGRLVYARGFGHADAEGREPVGPTALFRIASVSKPLTAVAVLALADRGKLGLDEPVFDRLKLTPLPGDTPDPRLKRVTVRHCLRHTGGWDRDRSFDPIGRPWEIARAVGHGPPVGPAEVVRYMVGKPLDFDPGERFAYSNLGYLVLGRLIEAAGGVGYERFVREAVLAPLGVRRPRLGRAMPEHRAAGEVRYHDPDRRTGRCLYPPRVGEPVPVPYGADNFDAYEAHGGWLASAVDLVRFAAGFDDPARCPVLRGESVEAMTARPAGAAGHRPDGRPRDAYYGCGWQVRPVGRAGKANLWHTGFIAGSEALLVRRWDGLCWAVLFNTHRSGPGGSLADRIDGRLHEAADAVTAWPGGDRFKELL